MSKELQIGLIGNPNVGKTSLFNLLTGLNHKVGNYPGITVDKKSGEFHVKDTKVRLIDLPGTYSIYPSSIDEEVVFKQVLLSPSNPLDGIIVVAEPENLKRNLFLFSQVQDLGIPSMLLINMSDKLDKRGIKIDIHALEEKLHTTIVVASSRKYSGIQELKESIIQGLSASNKSILNQIEFESEHFDVLVGEDYKKYVLQLTEAAKDTEDTKAASEAKRQQKKETIRRYAAIRGILENTYTRDKSALLTLTDKLDRILMHKIWGYLIFFGVLGVIFQGVFSWSSYPMDWIESGMNSLSSWVSVTMSPGILNDLISQGIIPGIQGVIIFIPQIAYLFFFITLLEQSGYMSRVVILMDKILRGVGLSGKSVVPLISGTACAIPAVMATRNIEDWRERLTTILVTPFTTCSARLPVYTILIGVVIPDETYGIFNLQGLVLFGLYILGFAAAILGAWFLKVLWKSKSSANFIVEIPGYQVPIMKNALITVYDKTKEFVLEAGKIILSISIILWFLGAFGPGEGFNDAETIVANNYHGATVDSAGFQDAVASYKLEHSYLGQIGKAIEPVIKPLGYDWKIGIALVSSFAAREVFVGALATIYSIGSAEEDEVKIKKRMAQEVNPVTGEPVFSLAVGISLLLFYAFAMQCMSTLAIVKRETHSWKWPIIQFIGMSGIAYIVALIAYQVLK